MRSGRKSEAQTPSPKKDRIKGSKVNPKGSASSTKSAKSIELSDSITTTLENKRDEYNSKHPSDKVTLATLKAVFRRGAGAYSSSHRPTITGGRPNSRSAWAFARVNKFLLKKGGTKVKAAYVQDDDLMERGGVIKKKLEGTLTKLGREKYIVKGDYKNQAKHTRELKNILSAKGLKEYSYEISPSTKSYYLEYANDKCEISIRLSNHTKASIFDDGEYEFIDASEDKNGYLRADIYICSNGDFEDAKKWIEENIQDDDLMAKGGEITWNEYVNTQFDENENRYLPENYFEEFTIQEGKKEDYPTILKEKDGLEYRKWEYGGIGVFDENKKVGFADNGSIQVSPLYQKRGIGIELVSLLKELNPSHRFGNMTPQGWNLMRSYYNKKVANRYDYDDNGGEIGQEITCRRCLWTWNTSNSDEHDKYVCHKCGFDNRTYYDSDPIGIYKNGGNIESDAFRNWFLNSKVVDPKGNPLIVYHGSPDLRGLKSDYIFKSRFENNQSFFFTDNYRMAKSYADPTRAFDYQNAEEGVVGLYLSIQNPLIVNAENQVWRKFETEINGEKIVGTRSLIEYAKNEHDGVIVKKVRDYYQDNEKKASGGNVYVVFKPTQIKLADGSNTTFDGDNPDIRYEEGGKLKKPHTIIEIAEKHNIKVSEVVEALIKGQKMEREHTNDDKIAKTIAQHHLWESPKYYEKLKEMEETFEDGGIFVLDEIALPDTYANIETLKRVLENQGYEIVKSVKNKDIFETGGMVVGKSHQEADENGTGEKFKLKSTGQVVELEGGEAVIVGSAIDSEDTISFNGEEKTPREIASYLNHAYGGVKFEKGGHITCGCSHKKYYHGGELPSAVVNSLNGGEAVITKKTMESQDKYEYEGERLTPRQILSRINHRYGGVSFAKGGKLTKFTNNPINIASKMIYFVNNIIYA